MGLNNSSELDPSEQDKNLRFYRNERKSSPWPGHTIEDMLGWYGKYGKLENNHSYIQWLFPIPEKSAFNPYAQPLREHEAKAIIDDEMASARVHAAYKMMLDFYGMKLVCDMSGEVARCKNWQARYQHLNSSIHNYRRITRIIQSLGELGFERYQVPWITFLIQESIVYSVLPNLNGGCMRHWIDAIKDDSERAQMRKNYRELFKKPEPDSSAHTNVSEQERKRDMCNGDADKNFSNANMVALPGCSNANCVDNNTHERPNIPTGDIYTDTNDPRTDRGVSECGSVSQVGEERKKNSAFGEQEQRDTTVSELNESVVKSAAKEQSIDTVNGSINDENTNIDIGFAEVDAFNANF